MKLNYVTHGGTFHADETGGEAALDLAGFDITTWRLVDVGDAEHIPGPKIVSDITGVYDPVLEIYDHHQRPGPKRDDRYPYAAFGLIWKHYGGMAVKNVLGCEDIRFAQAVKQRVDEAFVKGVDACDDDGEYYVEAFCSAGEVRPVTISQIIAGLNGDIHNSETQLIRYKRAVALMRTALYSAIEHAGKVQEAVDKWPEVVKNIAPRVVLLEEYLPWKEAQKEHSPETLYVIYPSARKNAPWSLEAVPKKLGRRGLVKNIERPDWFKGFIHKGQWIAGCSDLQEAVDLASWNVMR